ncbi:MAG: hypothetical protein IID16_00915 [Candidatus Marinimicrobia bacterium]|nr:hypothetical protein [Candidatus Neomarinimicrobiota bacterium]
MKNQEEIIIDVLKGMKGIGGVPGNEEFYAEFEMRAKAALGLADVKGSLPSHIEAGKEAKKYADEMNSKGEHNGFHELDFYNGTIWLRDMIEG